MITTTFVLAFAAVSLIANHYLLIHWNLTLDEQARERCTHFINRYISQTDIREIIDNHLEQRWWHMPSIDTQQKQMIEAAIAPHVRSAIEKYLSEESTVDTIVNKLNKKQLKG